MVRESAELERLEYEDKFILNDESKRFFDTHALLPPFRSTSIERWIADYGNILQGRILPTSQPYCRASFVVQIKLRRVYPFEPPELNFMDPIYHPNISESGQYCCNRRRETEEWNPRNTLADYIRRVIHSIDNPIIDNHTHIPRVVEYQTNYRKFYIKALNLTRKYGRPRRKENQLVSNYRTS